MTYTEDGWLPSHNATDLPEHWKLLMVLPISVYGALLLIAGSVGNFGLAIVLLRDRKRLKLTTRVLFCLMAAADTSVLWLAVLRYWVRITFGWDFRVAYPSICPLHVFAVYVSTNLAVAIFCTLCVDRCLVIYNSLEGYRIHIVGQTQNSNVNSRNPNEKQTQSKLCTWIIQLCQCIKFRRFFYRSCCSFRRNQSNKQPRRIIFKSSTRASSQFQEVISNPVCSCSSSIMIQNSFPSCNASSEYEMNPLPLGHEQPIPRVNSLGCSKLNPSSCSNKWHQTCCARLSSNYSQHSTRWLIIASIISLGLVLTKHIVAYNYVQVDPKRGCYSLTVAEWRDYLDFATQAVLSYLIIIPADVIVYRAIKRHQQVLTALRICAARGSHHASTFPPNIDRKLKIPVAPASPIAYQVEHSNQNQIPKRNNLLASPVSNTSACTSIRPSPIRKCSPHPSARAMVATATHLSRSHLFIFRTLITLSILHFVINLPGYLYAQVILPSLGDRWYTTFEGHLLYDSLFLISFTNNGASFFILLCTVHGFRQRVNSTIRKSGIYRFIRRCRLRFGAKSAHRSYVLKRVHRKRRSVLKTRVGRNELSQSIPSQSESHDFGWPSLTDSLHCYTSNFS